MFLLKNGLHMHNTENITATQADLIKQILVLACPIIGTLLAQK